MCGLFDWTQWGIKAPVGSGASDVSSIKEVPGKMIDESH